MNGYSAFPKALAILEPHHQIFCDISRTLVWRVLSLCREAVGVFYNPSQLGMSTCLGLFHVKRFGNRVHCMLIFIFSLKLFLNEFFVCFSFSFLFFFFFFFFFFWKGGTKYEY